jgi:hypothetical protein
VQNISFLRGTVCTIQNATQEQSRTTVQKRNTLPTFTVTLESRSPFLLDRCSCQLLKSCAGANMVCSRTERVFILAMKLFDTVREAFSNAYPGKEVPNKTTIHWLVTILGYRKCLWQVLTERQNSWNYCRIDFKQCISCNNGIRLQKFIIAIVFVVFWVKLLICSSEGCVLNWTFCTCKKHTWRPII